MIAVLTGDLVDSTNMSRQDYQLAIRLMEHYIQVCQKRFNTRGEIYRGDAIQLIFSQPQYAMRVAIELKSLLISAPDATKPIGITLSVGLGDQLIEGSTPSVSQGSAFTLSGRGLDITPSGHMSLHHEGSDFYDALVLATQFLDHLLCSHTKIQANVLYHYLLADYPTHSELATALGTSQQNVTKHLTRMGAELVKQYLTLYEAKVNN
ncbi:MarR family transcriptional regulator [Paraglaciecola sp. L1A13]|uniref:MarR family transcriptional regulator n=1 Tax=Paraglaciecola sp. L1A13 TaxID=2686359 RepID=UPI00131D5D78|nr:MarR family transcriptional regulator [Paraglaciecola sp. L1A13]